MMLRCLCLCVCVCVYGGRQRSFFLLPAFLSSLSLFLSPLFLCAGILLKQIGANRLCHCMTQGSPNRKGASQKERKRQIKGIKGEIKERRKRVSWRRRKKNLGQHKS